MKRVLVVDDEPKILEVVRDYLADTGFSVVTASDGPAALAQARAVLPDLVVLDLGRRARGGGGRRATGPWPTARASLLSRS